MTYWTYSITVNQNRRLNRNKKLTTYSFCRSSLCATRRSRPPPRPRTTTTLPPRSPWPPPAPSPWRSCSSRHSSKCQPHQVLQQQQKWPTHRHWKRRLFYIYIWGACQKNVFWFPIWCTLIFVRESFWLPIWDWSDFHFETNIIRLKPLFKVGLDSFLMAGLFNRRLLL